MSKKNTDGSGKFVQAERGPLGKVYEKVRLFLQDTLF